MSSEPSVLDKFRVPKKKNKETFELLSPDSDHRKYLISKISESFKKPEISKEAMKFHRSWAINIKEAENTFSKKRTAMRTANSQKFSESFGFFFVRTEFEMKKIVQIGKLEIGNCKESYLGNPTMGVSLSQHADLYHPEHPKAGFLLIVKYIRGKVHYLPCDIKPMDPQPNFDCHIARSALNDLSITYPKAFHSTQVFLYEFSEDGDIERFPSQMLIIGAVQFSWHSGPPYKLISATEKTSAINKRTSTDVIEVIPLPKRPHIASTTPPTVASATAAAMATAAAVAAATAAAVAAANSVQLTPAVVAVSSLATARFVNHTPSMFSIPPPPLPPPPPIIMNSCSEINVPIPETEIMLSTLIIGGHLPASAAMTNPQQRLTVKLVCRLKDPPMISNLISQHWNLVELLPCSLFEDYMCYTDNNRIDRYFALQSTIVNVFPIRFNDRKKLGATFRPKYAIHCTMVSGYFKDTKLMSRIIDCLRKKNSVGVVRCNPLSNIMFYIFPSGKTSKVLGVSAQDSPNTLHVVLLTEQHPEFLPCDYNTLDKLGKQEQKIFQDIFRVYEQSLHTSPLKKPLISLTVLKNSVAIHNQRQKEYFEKLPKSPSAAADSANCRENDDSDMDIDDDNGDLASPVTGKHGLAKPSNDSGFRKSLLPNGSQKEMIPVNHRADNVPVKPQNQFTSDSDHRLPAVTSKPALLPSPMINGVIPMNAYSSYSDHSHSLENEYTTTHREMSSIATRPPPNVYLGQFTLIRLPVYKFTRIQRETRSEKYKLQNSCTGRRPIYLDSRVFEKMVDSSYISVYRG